LNQYNVDKNLDLILTSVRFLKESHRGENKVQVFVYIVLIQVVLTCPRCKGT